MTVPVVSDSIWQLVRIRADLTPDRVLITDEHHHVLTFGELRERAEAVAAGLFELGIRPGDVAAWQLPSRIDTVVLCMALVRLSAIQNPLIPMLRESEIASSAPRPVPGCLWSRRCSGGTTTWRWPARSRRGCREC
jgi:cyclohexanecarboxylate-CoA ligase